MRAAIFSLCALVSAPAAAQTQMEMNGEAWTKFDVADKKLNATYAKLVAKISPKGRDALRAAQLTWIKFRDQECDFETMANESGSIHPYLEAGCREQMTLQRTKVLQQQIDCEEGDLGCGGQ